MGASYNGLFYVLFLFSTMVALLVSGCSERAQFCTAVYAPDFVKLAVHDTNMDAHDYMVELSGSATDVTCQVSAPARPEDDGPSDPFAGDAGIRFHACQTARNDTSLQSAKWRISHGESERVIHVTIYAAPESVDIRIVRDDELLVDTMRRPEYERTEPNGPGCGVTKRGSLRIDLAE